MIIITYILFRITSYITYRVYYYAFRDDSYVAHKRIGDNIWSPVSSRKIRLGPIRRGTYVGMYV